MFLSLSLYDIKLNIFGLFEDEFEDVSSGLEKRHWKMKIIVSCSLSQNYWRWSIKAKLIHTWQTFVCSQIACSCPAYWSSITVESVKPVTGLTSQLFVRTWWSWTCHTINLTTGSRWVSFKDFWQHSQGGGLLTVISLKSNEEEGGLQWRCLWWVLTTKRAELCCGFPADSRGRSNSAMFCFYALYINAIVQQRNCSLVFSVSATMVSK